MSKLKGGFIPAHIGLYFIKFKFISFAFLLFFAAFSFTFARNTIEVLTPFGGKEWVAGNEHTITWKTSITESDQMEVYLYRGNTEKQYLGSASTEDGEFDWDIPSELAPLPWKDAITNYAIVLRALDTSPKEAEILAEGKSEYFTIIASSSQQNKHVSDKKITRSGNEELIRQLLQMIQDLKKQLVELQKKK